MNPRVRAMFTSPRRLWSTVAITVAVCLFAMATVLAVRINTTLDRMETAKARPSIGVTAPGDVVPPVPDLASTGPLTTRDEEFVADPFADLGDPTPVVLAAVASWKGMDVEAMQRVFLPGALEQVIGTPPARSFRVTGEAVVETPGPTRSVLLLPTTVKPLEVIVVAVENRWMIESIGYRN
jgi:hypothetical protein